MAQYISTNVTSLVAQTNLAKSSSALADNLERLSSGQRINSASDDAAGMAIASRMTSQIRGNEMAKRNTADAISMVQTAEGAMGVQVEQLQRARELAVQSANGMLADSDRAKLENEQHALMAEFDKVATETTFNENKILNGGSETFQVGANSNETRDVTLTDTRASALGAVTSTTESGHVLTFDISADANIAAGGTTSVAHSGGVDLSAVTSGDDLTIDATSLNVGDQGVINVSTDDGLGNADSIGTAVLTITVTDPANSGFSVEYADASTSTPTLDKMDISTQAGASASLVSIDAALETVQEARADMGTYQNRFEQVQSGLDVSIANASASRGRIQDADFAKETADMTKNQILSQAGVAMLSQANQLPQNVLSLLR